MVEKFCLKWNDFETNVSKSFANLRTETQLFDVTLVGQDQRKVSAHRLVLSACSDFFKNIFYSNTHSHPMLYLDGVDSSDINLMLDYMYQGEVQIQQEQLDRFLDRANKFKLEGLMGMGSDVEHSDDMNTDNSKQYEEGRKQNKEVNIFLQEQSLEKNSGSQNFTPKPKKERAIKVLQDSSQMIDATNMDVTQLYQEFIAKEDGKFKCTVCEKTMGHKGSMTRHVEMHMSGLSYECKNCGETFRSRVILMHHIQSNH